ncbi:MAG: DUF4389 domain-containing protein, partial [Candidatus Competibacterales bacterium]|nr:DUF4389 domain-containing protein [Candidatus Competibacterales bacterium]
RSVSRYIYQVWRFLLFCSDQRPFPLSPWPAPGAAARNRQEPAPAAAESTPSVSEPVAGRDDQPQQSRDEAP